MNLHGSSNQSYDTAVNVEVVASYRVIRNWFLYVAQKYNVVRHKMSSTPTSSLHRYLLVICLLTIVVLGHHHVTRAVSYQLPVRRRADGATVQENVPETNGMFFGKRSMTTPGNAVKSYTMSQHSLLLPSSHRHPRGQRVIKPQRGWGNIQFGRLLRRYGHKNSWHFARFERLCISKRPRLSVRSCSFYDQRNKMPSVTRHWIRVKFYSAPGLSNLPNIGVKCM